MASTVQVNANSLPDQFWTGVRQIATVVGAWAVGKGYLQADTASALGAILLVAVPIAYGQWKTYLRATQLATIASSPSVPDAVAQIKGE